MNLYLSGAITFKYKQYIIVNMKIYTYAYYTCVIQDNP